MCTRADQLEHDVGPADCAHVREGLVGRQRGRAQLGDAAGAARAARTFATTRAPRKAPICTAAVPTPPLAPFTSRVSPDARPACRQTASKAVRNASGAAAAAASSSASGTAESSRSCAITRSARPPPPTSPNARSPAANADTPSPHATTGPPTSSPGTSVGAPAGTGCLPSRWSTSAGFTPAYAGAIATSNRPGAGSRRSSTATTSRPPTP